MMFLPRTDNSIVSRWWWTVDRWLLVILFMLLGIGILMAFAAGTTVSVRLNQPGFYLAARQIAFTGIGIALIVGVSMFERRGILRLAAAMFAVAVPVMILVLLTGQEINGAKRWLDLGVVTIQPSEFVKPALIVLTASILEAGAIEPEFPHWKISCGFLIAVLAVLALQPDFGQIILISAIWAGQVFVAGLPLFWFAVLSVGGLSALILSYLAMPHVAARIDAFLSPSQADTFQVDRALDAVRSGGLFGQGPGEGVIKHSIPDSHSDFVFAVAAEEFGALAGAAILAAFAAVVIRGLARLLEEQDLFAVLAVGGLLTLFGLQAFINIGVTLGVVPATGMTLPFVSYGGSSLMATAIGMGMVLALTRTKKGAPRRRARRRRR